MRIPRRWLLAVILCFSLALAGLAWAADTPSLLRWVIGNGGGHLANGSLSLDGTVGQSLVGVSVNGSTSLHHGFWFVPSSGDTTLRVYLPLIER